jgi:hypothetical protein
MTRPKHSLNFGKKEKVLNYACQTYQLSRPNKVGAVMALIRERQPHTIEEWERWYFDNACTGKVFAVFSLDGEIGNKDVIAEIEKEIARLR